MVIEACIIEEKKVNGRYMCKHNKQKYSCKDCGGLGICEHGKRKARCSSCSGSSLCEHDKIKYRCKICGGSEICEHKKSKVYCRECKGSSFCEHGRRKYICKDCNGSSVCQHKRQKTQCKDCNGSSICEHNKRKSYCKLCGGSALCKTPLCETYATKKYEGYCLTCFIHMFPDKPNVRNYKTKEKDVSDRIIQCFSEFTWVADKRVQDGCSKRRPDLLLDMGSHIIIVEIDENKHTDYDCSCEHKRLMELSQDLQHRPIVFIRFNPDDYINQEGVKVKSCWRMNKSGIIQITKTKIKEWEDRIDALKQQIQYWIDNPSEKTIEIVELFY